MSKEPNRSNARGLDTQADDVENASLDSFPASDPPKWSGLRLGPPAHSELAPEAAEEKDRPSHRPPVDSEQAASSSGG